MFGLHWDSLHNLMWLPVILVVVLCYYFYWYKVVAVVNTLKAYYSPLITRFSYSVMIIKLACMTTACCMLLVALLSPAKSTTVEKTEQLCRNLFIALDISKSMAATDCAPNRLNCAKEKIHALIEEFKSERVGLILFAGSAFVYCPLTSDYQLFFQLLESVDLDTMASSNTALDKPILCALSAFEQSNAQKKLLLLITDGEDFGANMQSAIGQAVAQDLCICVLGVGTTNGAPIPLYDERGTQIGHQKDKNQKVVISALQEGVLKKLAADLKGVYASKTADSSDLQTLLKFIAKREKEQMAAKDSTIKEFYYHYFLFIALWVLIIEWIL